MIAIKDISTKLSGLKLFKIKSYSDERGLFREVYNRKIQKHIGEDVKFIQHNESYSKFGVLRGLHFQRKPEDQSKLVRVSYGEVQDVVVDIRKDSKTFGNWESFILSSSNNRLLFIPKGFAHGFLVLSSEAVVNYQVDNFFNPNFDAGIRYDDMNISIDWLLKKQDLIVSQKDKNLPFLK